jgi:hypothetical protein
MRKFLNHLLAGFISGYVILSISILVGVAVYWLMYFLLDLHNCYDEGCAIDAIYGYIALALQSL